MLFRSFFDLFSMFFFYVLSFFIMLLLYFCFSMFCRSMFCHRPNEFIRVFFLSNISFGRLKETSQGNVSFQQLEYILLLTVIKTYHEYVLFSESSVSQ